MDQNTYAAAQLLQEKLAIINAAIDGMTNNMLIPNNHVNKLSISFDSNVESGGVNMLEVDGVLASLESIFLEKLQLKKTELEQQFNAL